MKRQVVGFVLLYAATMLHWYFCPAVHAGRISGMVSLRGPEVLEACDTLRVNPPNVPHMVHGRIMAGVTWVWEDSVASVSGGQWELFYPELRPGTYQASSWTTKATNSMVGCPEVLNFTVEPAYSIVFGWTTVGAVYNNREGRVIGAAEMMRLLNECEAK